MKKKIALVTGGYSGEAEISYKSAATIEANLDKNKYQVYKIDITKNGWIYTAPDERRLQIDKNDFSLNIDGNHVKFDGVLIAMHGTPGEDGKLQGYFDMIGLPYTGCNAATSAITFNKRYGVAIAKMGGVSVANSVHLFHHTPYQAADILQELQIPVFVKPNNGGSSIGMSKVNAPEELEAAIQKAFKEDDQVLIEQMIQGREFTVGVYKAAGEVRVLALTEVAANASQDFFDFEAKYHGHSTEITPAVVDTVIEEKIREAAKHIYRIFNCRGVIRIDFIYNETDGKPYMLEVNTIPGQSAASIIPQQVAATGGNLKDFYTALVDECFV